MQKVVHRIIAIALLLPGCAPVTGEAPPIKPIRSLHNLQDARTPDFISRPQPELFSICHGSTCRNISHVSLDADDWTDIETVFRIPPVTPAAERELLAQAIARFETLVGAKTGTDANLGGNFAGLGKPGQLDCIDEATNTTVYLTLLQNAGYLQWHRVDSRVSRGIANLSYPHTTAVIRETGSGERYAVDAWFEDSGKPSHIVPLSNWRRGWQPGWNDEPETRVNADE